MGDAATGGAGGFCNQHRRGAQCEGVCGEGLQTCGENHRVSAHTDTHTKDKTTDPFHLGVLMIHFNYDLIDLRICGYQYDS